MDCSYCCSGDEPEQSFTKTPRHSDAFHTFVCKRLTALKAHSVISYEHSIVTAKLSLLMSVVLQLSEYERSLLYWNSLLHDIGKIAVSRTILQKPTKLTDDEYRLVLTHTNIGYNDIVSTFYAYEYFLPILHHHTAYDELVKLNFSAEVVLITSILSIIDAIEAITAPRPYDPVLRSVDEAIKIMEDDSSKYDITLIETIISAKDRLSEVLSVTRGKLVNQC
jgi:HD-GYP domain-containing protein (c-di-GMP phosphodiesterase class II)